MKVTTQARRHAVILPVAGRPSDWSVEAIEAYARRKITGHYGGKARIISLHADHYEIKMTIEVDEIHIDYSEEQGAQ